MPRELPLPAIFVGVDVFHAPMVYDPLTGTRRRRDSVAAVVVRIVRQDSAGHQSHVEIYSRKHRRDGDVEHRLGPALQQTIAEALKRLQVQPASAIVWRDGIAETSFSGFVTEEIDGVRQGMEWDLEEERAGSKRKSHRIPLAYVVCQKDVATKFLVQNGRRGAPSGTLVNSLPDWNRDRHTFSPSTSTARRRPSARRSRSDSWLCNGTTIWNRFHWRN